MKELKFRVWDTKNKQFLSQSSEYYHIGDVTGIPYTLNEILNKLDRFVVQQFTGLKDSKGVEVWEGDILVEKHDGREGESYIGVVTFVAGTFALDGDTLYNYVFSHSPDILEDFTVEGNIFENSELLKNEN